MKFAKQFLQIVLSQLVLVWTRRSLRLQANCERAQNTKQRYMKGGMTMTSAQVAYLQNLETAKHNRHTEGVAEQQLQHTERQVAAAEQQAAAAKITANAKLIDAIARAAGTTSNEVRQWFNLIATKGAITSKSSLDEILNSNNYK